MSLLKYLPDSFKEKVRARAGAVTENARLRNLRSAGFRPRQIIDGGAYMGVWTETVQQIFPEAEVLMIEPQVDRKDSLIKMTKESPMRKFSACALSGEKGESLFFKQHSNSRIIDAESDFNQSDTISVRTDTLWNICAEHQMDNVDLVKLDLQGHEMEALKGSGTLWGSAEVFIVETSWLPIGTSVLAEDIIFAMKEKGYRLYDIYGFNHRPLDLALWQTDFIFVKLESKLIASREWQ